jgi:hypothetical protein
MFKSLWEEPTSLNQYSVNTLNARTWREAADLYLEGRVFANPTPPPPLDSSESIIYQIKRLPCLDESIVNR